MDNNNFNQNENGYQAPPSYNPGYQNQSFNYGYDPNYAPNIPTKAPMAPEVAQLSGSALTRSIVALIFAEWPILCFIAIFLGFGAKKKGQAAQNLANQLYCESSPKAVVGKILGLIAGILGIIMTFVWAIYALYFALIIGFMSSAI